MKKELEKKLIEKFPRLFKGKGMPLTENLMSFGCEINDGWYDLMYETCTKLNDFPVILVQVKEKFAGLRIYIDPDDNLIKNMTKYEISEVFKKAYQIINDMEEKSFTICEVCGKEGKTYVRNYWYKTLCEDHKKEFEYQEIKEFKEKKRENDKKETEN